MSQTEQRYAELREIIAEVLEIEPEELTDAGDFAEEYQAEQDKRWVLIAPPGAPDGATSLLLARASKPEQEAFVGDQAGGRVFLFLRTDDFRRDYEAIRARGVHFVREPKRAPYGTVAVFEDLYGNLWDLVEFAEEP